MIDIEPLFPALSLQLLLVSHTAKLIYASCQSLSQAKKGLLLQTKHHELFGGGRGAIMDTNVRRVQKDCAV